MKRAILGLIILIETACASLACSCRPPLSFIKAFEESDNVFYGKVVRLENESGFTIATIEVGKKFKGEIQEVQTVFTRRDIAACAFPFIANRAYLIYASNSALTGTEKISLYTHLCTRTKEFNFDDDSFIEKAHESIREELKEERQFYLKLEEQRKTESSG